MTESKGLVYLLMGGTGVGKSSIIKSMTNNNYTGERLITGSGSCGQTFKVTQHEDKSTGEIWIDTPGFCEAKEGKVSSSDVISELTSFLKFNQSGFNLIIFVRKCDRLTEQSELEYKIAMEFARKAPMVVVSTGDRTGTPNGWLSERCHPNSSMTNAQDIVRVYGDVPTFSGRFGLVHDREKAVFGKDLITTRSSFRDFIAIHRRDKISLGSYSEMYRFLNKLVQMIFGTNYERLTDVISKTFGNIFDTVVDFFSESS